MFCLNVIFPIFWQNPSQSKSPHSPLAWHTSHSALEWTQYIDALHRFMAIFVPRLILNDKQFVEKSFIHSKSTSACCCFFTRRGQGFRNWFQTPKLLPTKCWYSRRKALVTKGIFVCKNLKSLLIFHCYCISFLQVSPWIELHPPGLSTIGYIFLMLFSGFDHSGSREIQ